MHFSQKVDRILTPHSRLSFRQILKIAHFRLIGLIFPASTFEIAGNFRPARTFCRTLDVSVRPSVPQQFSFSSFSSSFFSSFSSFSFLLPFSRHPWSPLVVVVIVVVVIVVVVVVVVIFVVVIVAVVVVVVCLKNDHPDDPASCKGSSGYLGSCIVHPEGLASYK